MFSQVDTGVRGERPGKDHSLRDTSFLADWPEGIHRGTEHAGATEPSFAHLRINNADYKFTNDAWTLTHSDVLIFDPVFVNENVYSGDYDQLRAAIEAKGWSMDLRARPALGGDAVDIYSNDIPMVTHGWVEVSEGITGLRAIKVAMLRAVEGQA